MKKQILVPLDGSQLAEMILPHAIAYARANDYTLALLHVVSPPTALNSNAWGMSPSTEIWEGWQNEVESGKNYVHVVADQVRKLGMEVHTHVMEADPAECIVAFAQNNPQTALIAMSTHGRSGIGRLVLGSVVERVLHTSPVPLLVAHPAHEENILNNIPVPEYKSILVPLDGSDFAVQALIQAKTVVRTLGASITLVTATAEAPLGLDLNAMVAAPQEWTPEREERADYLKKMVQQLKDEFYHAQGVLEYGPPASAILRVARLVKADMIVMSTHGRSGVPRLWLGSVAMRVVHDAECPVLLMRTAERVKVPDHQRISANIVPAGSA